MKTTDLLCCSQGLALVCVLALGAATLSGTPGLAEEHDDYSYYDGDDSSNPNERLEERRRGANPYEIVRTLQAAPDATTSITQAINDSYDFCARISGDQYLVDCLGQQLQDIVDAIPKTGDYGASHQILDDAATKLRRLAAANRAPAEPRVRAKGSVRGRQITTKPLTPVRQDRVRQVNQQAAAILEEAETKLLRSAESSDRRLIAYAQMAKAVGSNKTLLRSA